MYLPTRSLNYTFLGILLAVAIVPAAIVITFIQQGTQTRLEEQIIDDAEVIVIDRGTQIEQTLGNLKSIVLTASKLPPIQGILRAEETGFDEVDNSSLTQWTRRLETIFASILETHAIIDHIRFIDEEGQELVRVNQHPTKGISFVRDTELQFKGEETYFTETAQMNEGDIYISSVDLNKENGEIELPYKPTLRIATPVFDHETGDFSGIVVGNMLFDEIVSSISSDTLEDIIIIDRDGVFLLHPDEQKRFGDELGRDANYFVEQPELLGNVEQYEALAYHDIEEEEFRIWRKLFFDAADPEQFWILFSVIDENVLLRPIRDLRTPLVFGFILLIIVVLLISLGMTRYFVKPIQQLIVFAQKIRDGNVEPLKASELREKKNELGTLARTLIGMSETLHVSRKALQEKVEQRTQELNTTLDKYKQQNEEFEKVRKAILNILEDLQLEKDKLELQVQETAKFRQAVESSQEGIVMTDLAGNIIYVNGAWERLNGYTREEVLGKNPNILRSNKTDSSIYNDMWGSLNRGYAFDTEEIVNTRKDGSTYEAHLSIYPIRKGETTLFYVGIVRDVSTRRQIDRAKTEFVSLASHQLRTPLSAINWYVEMLLSGDAGKLTKEQQEYLQEIFKGNRRMVELVDALLNVSRLELGTVMIQPKNTSLLTLAQEVIKELSPKIQEKELTFSFDYKDDIVLSVDPKLFRMVVQNLLSNAVKYTPAKGEVTMRYRMCLQGEVVNTFTLPYDAFVMTVTDTGYGIPFEQQKRIFGKLFRADNVVGKDVEGTGLGLYIVKSVIEQSDGHISFVSEEGKGTTFYVVLPLSGMKAQHVTETFNA